MSLPFSACAAGAGVVVPSTRDLRWRGSDLSSPSGVLSACGTLIVLLEVLVSGHVVTLVCVSDSSSRVMRWRSRTSRAGRRVVGKRAWRVRRWGFSEGGSCCVAVFFASWEAGGRLERWEKRSAIIVVGCGRAVAGDGIVHEW